MHVDSYQHGTPSWVDLGTPDVDSSVAFYSAMFGWDCPQGPPDAGGYRVCTLNGRTVAGLGPLMNPAAPPAWLSYIDVDSADAVAERVVANGGQVFVQPFDVLDAGRMAVCADATGAVFGLWQPGAHPGAGIVNETGAWCWSELVSTDVDASVSFYAAALGWGVSPNPADGPMQYGEWQLDGRTIGGVMPKPPTMPAEVPSYWGVYFTVDDVDASVEKATGLGASVLMPPSDVEPGRMAVLTDPVGAMFSIIRFAEQPS